VVIAAMAAAQVVLLRRSWTLNACLPAAVYGLSFVVAFFVGTPYAILDFETFERDLRFTVDHLSGGHGVNLGRGWSYHPTRSLPYGVGPPTFIAAVAGLIPFVRHYPRAALIVGGFAAAFFASLAGGQTVFFRYVLPLVPFVCLSAAIGTRHVAAWVADRAGLSERAVLAMATVLIAVPSLVNCVWFDVLLAKTDTRVLAGRWLEGQLRPDMALYDAGSPYARLDLSRARFHRWEFDPVTKSFGHPEGKTPDWLVFHESPLREYTRVPPELRQLAQEKYALVETFTATRRRTRVAVYDQQDAFFMPVSGFASIVRPGPTISIYRRSGP
jgi:hypothetical protein